MLATGINMNEQEKKNIRHRGYGTVWPKLNNLLFRNHTYVCKAYRNM